VSLVYWLFKLNFEWRSSLSQLEAIALLFHGLERSLGYWSSMEKSLLSSRNWGDRSCLSQWGDRSIIVIQWGDRASLSQLRAISASALPRIF
jgi:hypothetical protein